MITGRDPHGSGRCSTPWQVDDDDGNDGEWSIHEMIGNGVFSTSIRGWRDWVAFPAGCRTMVFCERNWTFRCVGILRNRL